MVVGDEADYTQISPTFAEAFPIGELARTTIHKVTRADITTSVTSVAMTATGGAAILVAVFYAAAAANPTTRAAATDPATTTKAPTLDARKKPDAQRETAETKAEYNKMAVRIDKPQNMPTELFTDPLARFVPNHA